MEIVARGGCIKRLTDSRYLVRSQRRDGWYKIEWRNRKWRCQCPDYSARKEACKHVYAVIFFLRLPSILLTNLNYELLTCPRDNAPPEKIVGIGVRRNKSGATRRFECKQCGYRFSDRLGFAKMRNDPMMVIVTLDLYFKGLSLRQIQHHLWSIYGCETSHMSPYRWIRNYVKLISRYVDKLTPRTGSRWHADEMMVKVNGKADYLWNVLDKRTRYLLVSELTTGRSTNEASAAIGKAIAHAKKKAETLISDGLKSYKNASKKQRIRRHVSGVRFTDQCNNNIIERLNETLRPRYDLTLGLGGLRSGKSIARGLRLYYNFIRPHTSLGGRTPSDCAKIELKGRNRWLALTKASTRHPTSIKLQTDRQETPNRSSLNSERVRSQRNARRSKSITEKSRQTSAENEEKPLKENSRGI
jgi:transposase-like protein